MFVQAKQQISHLRRPGCIINFRRHVLPLRTFEQFIRHLLCLIHVESGWRDLLINKGAIPTEHIRYEGNIFRSLAGLSIPKKKIKTMEKIRQPESSSKDARRSEEKNETANETAQNNDDTVVSHESEDKPIGKHLITHHSAQQRQSHEQSESKSYENTE